MFRIFYDVILPRLGGPENVSIAFSDTDSMVLHSKILSKEEVLKRIAGIMDFSNQNLLSPLYNIDNKKVPGFMKDEHPDTEIVELIAPKSKCYVLRLKGEGNEIFQKRCKGVTKAKIRNIGINEFARCIKEKIKIKGEMSNISAKNNVLRTLLVNKVCMSSFDDKRYLLECGIHSVPHGSLLTNETCTECQI